MNNLKLYRYEYLLISATILLSIAGFWNIYFGARANPTPYQNLHVVTAFVWLFLLLYQLSLIGKKQSFDHKKVGLAILFVGPFLFATTALLMAHSAHKGVVSGEGDFLVVQNVLGSLELGLLILGAFIWRKKRKLHGYFILSTVLIFMGIALFFTLISFVPQFRIEGPETFYRFATAAAVGRYVCLFIGILFFIRDRKNGWPMMLAGASFSFNELVNTILNRNDLIQPLTAFVGSFDPLFTFVGSFIVLLTLLILTGVTKSKQPVAAAQSA